MDSENVWMSVSVESVGVGLLKLPAPEAGDFVEWILLYCDFTSGSLLATTPAGYATELLLRPS
jgi:hypothetical protein